MHQPATQALPAVGKTAAAPAAQARTRFGTRVHRSLDAAEADWRDLETRAVLTPYQRFDWIAAWHRAGGTTGRLAIVVVDIDGRPAALLPLEIGRRLGLQRATFVGADVGNSDWLVFDPGLATELTPHRIADALHMAARQVGGIDLVSLFDQPAEWAGLANPLLAFPHQPGPDHFHFGRIDPRGSFDRFDDKRLANLNRRKRKLAEMLGPVDLRAATTPQEIARVHQVFLEQRAARFAHQGIANIFAEPHFVRFMREAAISSLASDRPTTRFHALYAGETIVATSFGAFCGTHYSQYINSTEGGEAAKFRLIGILMHELFKDCAARGATTIDMGLGDFDYKADWTEPQTACDGMIPLTAAGRLGGTVLLAGRRAKRAIKQHDRLWALAKKLRAALARPAAP
jgi:CelD/BcsL family acetyltransferase involved in cellulose biosynthesis